MHQYSVCIKPTPTKEKLTYGSYSAEGDNFKGNINLSDLECNTFFNDYFLEHFCFYFIVAQGRLYREVGKERRGKAKVQATAGHRCQQATLLLW